MPWDGSRHGGFSIGEPWPPAYADADTIGVAAQLEDPAAFLALYRELLRLRHALGWSRGSITPLESTAGELAYDRNVDGRRYRVVARIDDGTCTTALPVPGRLLLRATQPVSDAPAPVDAVTLAGPDAAVLELAAG